MSQPRICLRLRRPLEERFDASILNPGCLVAMAANEIGAIRLNGERSHSIVSDWFEVEGEKSNHLHLEGDCTLLDRLGYEMENGQLTIGGSAGSEAGTRMLGGHLEIEGDCGDRLAQSMRGGRLFVHGKAGPWAACGMPGEKQGMRGGELVVFGDVGDDACQRMRRGLVMIGGNVGDRLAGNLLAGTIFLSGKMGNDWGSGMRRGSLILVQEPEYRSAGQLTSPRPFELSYLPILWKEMRRLLALTMPSCSNFWIPESRWVMRRLGDRGVDGVAEVLQAYPVA